MKNQNAKLLKIILIAVVIAAVIAGVILLLNKDKDVRNAAEKLVNKCKEKKNELCDKYRVYDVE